MQKQNYTALRRRLFGTLLLLSLVPLLALGMFCADRLNSAHGDKVSSILGAVGRNKVRSIDTFLIERVAQIKNLTYTHSYEDLINVQSLSQIFSTMQANGKHFVDIGVIGRNGKHLAYVGPYDLAAPDYSETEWFNEVMRKGVYVSDMFMGFRNEPHFIIAVMRHEGVHTYIVRATIDLAALNSLAQRTYEGERSDAFLVNKDGILQTQSLFNGNVMSQMRLQLPKGAEDFKKPFSVPMQEVGQEEPVEYLALVYPLSVTSWRLVMVEDVRGTLAPLQQLRIFIMLFVVLGALLAAVGALLATRSLINYLMEQDKKQAQLDAQLTQSSKMAALGKMATGVAHEINNPLMLIRESAGWMRDLLAEEKPENYKNYQELCETAEKIEQHVERASGITHRMLGFGRTVAPSQGELFVPMLLDQTISFLEGEARLRNIEIVRKYDEGVGSVVTDGSQLQQVFLNIIDNALDAVGKDGTITVHVEAWQAKDAGEAGCRVRITDTGSGIPQDKLKRIFDPFFTTKKPGEGTGLGLSICFTILESLGATIHVESEVGVGTSFIISLPHERNK
jgi:two-component system NtrC family sensor kinase